MLSSKFAISLNFSSYTAFILKFIISAFVLFLLLRLAFFIFVLKGALNLNFLNLTINRENFLL